MLVGVGQGNGGVGGVWVNRSEIMGSSESEGVGGSGWLTYRVRPYMRGAGCVVHN